MAKETLSSYIKLNNITSISGINVKKIAQIFNVSEAGVKNRIYKLKNKTKQTNNLEKSQTNELVIDNSENKSSIISKSNRIKTVDDLVKAANIDLSKNKIIRSIINKWEVGTSINTINGKEILTEELWQVKLFLEPILESEKTITKEDIIKEILAEIPKRKEIKLKDSPKSGYNYLLSIPDLHIGKLGIKEETGKETNSEIAINRYYESIRQLIHKCNKYQNKLDEITLIVGNDFMNFEGMSRSTTKGTPQDTDLRWTEMFRKSKDLIIQSIEYALGFSKKVNVIMVAGNHDEQSNFYLGLVLSAYFNNDQRVYVDDNSTLRKYFKWGKSLWGFTHGDCEKWAELPSIMSDEAKKMWAETEYREWFTGHFHKTAQKGQNIHPLSDEFKGVQIITMPSLSGTDYWHYKNGYVGNIPRAIGRLYHIENGLECIFNWNSNI